MPRMGHTAGPGTQEGRGAARSKPGATESRLDWRRRLPRRLALATGRTCIKSSLQTKEPVRARLPAAQLDAPASHLFMSLPGNANTREQLGQVFKRALVEHQAKLSRYAAFARQEEHFDPTAERAIEFARRWAYWIIATKGPAAHIARSDEARLRQQGLEDEAIGTIRACLLAMDSEVLQRRPSPASPRCSRRSASIRH